MNVAPCHVFVEWHCVQSIGIPVAEWFGSRRCLVFIQVTACAIRRNRANAPLVTRRTRNVAVTAGERERRWMCKRGAVPCRGGMALRAIGGECRGLVIGIRRRLELVQMARCAIARQVSELSNVTHRTLQSAVTCGEWERQWVSKERVAPVRSAMAFRAVGWETGGRVVRIVHVLIVVEVATRTVRRNGSNRTGMALCTVLNAMPFGKRERIRMFEGGLAPIAGPMALCAIERYARGGVIRLACCVVIVAMAAYAVRGNWSGAIGMTL